MRSSKLRVPCCFATAMAVRRASSAGAGSAGSRFSSVFAADAMKLRLECTMTDAIARRQRLVEDGDGAARIARLIFRLGQRNLQEPVEQQNVLFAQQLGASAHVLEPVPDRAPRGGRPTLEKHAERAPHRQHMFAREAGEFEDVRCGARQIAAHQFE